MKRANGTGTIYKLKGAQRRKPYRARVTIGWELNVDTGKSKQVIKDLGTYATQKEALNAIQSYLNCPYDLSATQMTMKDFYEIWWESYSKKLKTDNSRRTITNAWEYCSLIYNVKLRDIKSYHLKDCIENASRISTRGADKGKTIEASACVKSRIKSVFNLMFDMAYERELVDRNYARAFELDTKITEQKERDKRVNVIFSKQEIQLLWDNIDNVKFADMILIGIYSGWRPQELAILKLENIDLEDQIIVGGLKTLAGENRTVPIHPDIKELVEKNYKEAEKIGSEYLFNDLDGQRGTYMTYDKYSKRFKKVMRTLKMYDHHPHETRHTFITQANRSGIDPIMRDRIVGHGNAYALMKVYDHRDIEDLKTEMKKVKFL